MFRLIVGFAFVLLAVPAIAGGLDYSTLTDAVDFGEVGPAVLAAAGALVAIYVIVKGIKMIIGFVRGDSGGASFADWSQGGLVNHEGGGMADGSRFERYRYADGEEHEVRTRDRA